MKILALFLIMLSLSSISTKKSLLKKSENPHGGYILHSTSGFKSPRIVADLSGKPTAPKISADEVSTGNVFYDGSTNLGVLNVNCDVLSSNAPACVNNDKCGWCGDKSTCIPGTSRGPLAPCLKNTYIYNNNNPNWNPLKAGTININTGGAIEIVQKPDLNLVHVNKPYN